MTLVGFPGSKLIKVGPNILRAHGFPFGSNSTMDAVNEAVIMIGHIETSDGGSHTINTTGSSSIFWLTAGVTFANAGTAVKVGIATVDTILGVPGRAVAVSHVITFDVSKTLVGGGGGITANAAQNHVPDTGSKTIANGDLVAVCIQMTARAGSDTVTAVNCFIENVDHFPYVVSVLAGVYTAQSSVPNVFITFSDGATGWFFGTDIFVSLTNRTWNSGSATKEYGQLYSLPFPLSIYGIHGQTDCVSSSADFNLVLYSDPLGSPVAERTISIEANTASTISTRYLMAPFASPYSTTANEIIGVVMKPTTGADVALAYKTIQHAGQRVSEPWGTSGYGISRASGAFANDGGASLIHYYIGPIAGAFNEEASAAVMGGSVIS